MKKEKFIKKIIVGGNNILPSLYFTNYPASQLLNDINELSKFYKTNILHIENIKKVLSGEIHEIDSLDTNMVEFWVRQKDTRIKNYLFDDIPEIYIPTEEFLSFFIEQKKFVESFNKETLLKLVTEALYKIKAEPQYDENNYYYTLISYKGEEIYVCFSIIDNNNKRALKEEVMLLDVEKIVSELKVNNNYFGRLDDFDSNDLY